MISAPRPSNVTITLLPVSLSLVHIPRARLPHLTHPVLRQILQPNPIFLNVTCNEIELTLFAEHRNLADLERVARQDRQRQRSRSGSGSSRKRPSLSDDDRVEITCERWNVLQIDSHSDQMDNSGARVHELSAPLAAAGISILYQSSYMSDFIFVKQSRLHQVIALLTTAGFDLYSSDGAEPPSLGIISPSLSPDVPHDANTLELGHDFSLESGAVLTRSVDASVDTSQPPRKLNHVSDQRPTPHQHSRTKSQSPSSCDVSILSTDLACVGLSDEDMNNWALKIVKLVAFPDLIPLTSSFGQSTPYFSGPKRRGQIPITTKAETIQLPCIPHHTRSSSTDSLTSSSDEAEDGYFSHSPVGSVPISPTQSFASSRSFPDLTKTTTPNRSRQVVSPFPHFAMGTKARGVSPTALGVPCHRPAVVPFFSFTRTSEGSSLTTDVSLLAALFPQSERHMLSCAGELDALDSGPFSRVCDSEDSDEDEDMLEEGTLRCLQIDLRRFGLDKHGLVNRYSRVLEDNGINHMYSSTYKTANLLVAKAHASRARDLLKS